MNWKTGEITFLEWPGEFNQLKKERRLKSDFFLTLFLKSYSVPKSDILEDISD